MRANVPKGMGGGPQNMQAMLRQAQKMQEDMAILQEELDAREYEIKAGGGVVTVKINGTDKTYPAGTKYGQIMQDQIDADGVKMKVWDPAADDGIGSSDGFDGWYNPEAAAKELAKAVEELKKVGIEVSAENPIYLDMPTRTDSQVTMNMKQVVKQSVEEATGGAIVINLVEYSTRDTYLDATYWYGAGNEANFDLNDGSGWGPDFGDPSSYLGTMLPQYAGYMTKCLGIF